MGGVCSLTKGGGVNEVRLETPDFTKMYHSPTVVLDTYTTCRPATSGYLKYRLICQLSSIIFKLIYLHDQQS